MRSPELESAESLSGIWSALHKTTPLIILESEVHYIRMLAVAAEDDLVSHLLLKKLRLAAIADPAFAPPRLVAMNSFLEYSFDGGPQRFAQLLHPSAVAAGYGLAVTSLIGAGLIGLAAGQTILWPDEKGTLCDLHVQHVENCPGLAQWVGGGEPACTETPRPRLAVVATGPVRRAANDDGPEKPPPTAA